LIIVGVILLVVGLVLLGAGGRAISGRRQYY